LVDVWARAAERSIYTQYTRQRATRLDRVYVTRNIIGRKVGAETIMTAFTDHSAMALRITLGVPTIHRGRGYWNMIVTLLQETLFRKRYSNCGHDGRS
jgi:hypothetical protein